MGKNLKQGMIVAFLVFLLLAIGCASAFMKGGSLVGAGYQPPKVLVSYRTEGTAPAGVKYLLVRTETGEAIFEKSPDGSGALMQTYWRDDKGDHYAGWVVRRHGYEFVVPLDRTKEASRYVYPGGTYELKQIGGVWRPVPVVPIGPVTRLIPE
jgi:hypothetical protein